MSLPSPPMSTQQRDDEVNLPDEIEYEIFRLAYHEAEPKDRMGLLVVAKRVTAWLIPLIYQCITIKDWKRPPIASIEKYGRYTRHIFTELSADAAFDHDVLYSSCPNVSNIILWYDARATEKLFDLPLNRLLLHHLPGFEDLLNTLHSTDHVKAWCSNITHLAWGTFTPSSCPLLAHFPNLTHFLIGAWNEASLVGEALKHCPQVQVVIWLLSSYRSNHESFVVEPNEEMGPSFDDYRVVTINGYLFKDWIRGTQGEEDMWAIAERKVIERRIEGLIPWEKGCSTSNV